jgi:hypothetical protein
MSTWLTDGQRRPGYLGRYLKSVHRWLGIFGALWLLLWFSSGLVMHFKPYPALTTKERLQWMLPLQTSQVQLSPKALQAQLAMPPSSVHGWLLWQRGYEPVYQIKQPDGPLLYSAVSGKAIAPLDSARQVRQLLTHYLSAKQLADSQLRQLDYDQWTLAASLQPHRPLWRLELPDGQWWYFSGKTGEVLRDVSASERRWNYAGAVLHWVYLPQLRMQQSLWRELVWVISLLCLLAALSGFVLGISKMRRSRHSRISPYRRSWYWHHLLGLTAGLVLLSYLLSGWLSLDNGRLFKAAAPVDSSALQGNLPAQPDLPAFRQLLQQASAAATPIRELQWLQLDSQLYLRVLSLSQPTRQLPAQLQQKLLAANSSNPGQSNEPQSIQAEFSLAQLTSASRLLSQQLQCEPLQPAPADAYRPVSQLAGATIYRQQCRQDDLLLHYDSAHGELVSQQNAAMRAYRWWYQALHRLDFPGLIAIPWLHTLLTVLLNSIGLLFTATALLLAYRRLRS